MIRLIYFTKKSVSLVLEQKLLLFSAVYIMPSAKKKKKKIQNTSVVKNKNYRRMITIIIFAVLSQFDNF